MKRGIDVVLTYDRAGRSMVIVRKAKGMLSIEEVRDALREVCGSDYYVMVLDCFHESDDLQYDEDCAGDAVECYYLGDAFREMLEGIND